MTYHRLELPIIDKIRDATATLHNDTLDAKKVYIRWLGDNGNLRIKDTVATKEYVTVYRTLIDMGVSSLTNDLLAKRYKSIDLLGDSL